MGLHPSSSAATALALLEAAGIAIVEADDGWYIKFYWHMTGPYATPEAALDASMAWISESNVRQVGQNAAKFHD